MKNYIAYLSGFESSWYKCQFKDDINTYNCLEQYIMYKKAMLFGDLKLAEEILKTEQPRFQTNLGNKIKNYDEEIWNKNIHDIIFEGNMLKFKQNSRIKKLLIQTYPKILAFADPNDKFLGIGLSKDDPAIEEKAFWDWGVNLHGKILMEVRDKLMNKN